ncbi:MAG: YeeE/YedE family protein [Bacteroidia bacterium]|nr:YeeE/YedE family protein [Bacteroidia bacterium]
MNEIYQSVILAPWPWYVAGPIMGLSIPLLLFFGNKMLGVSSSMQHICAALIPTKAEYFNYDWKTGAWNIVVAIGIVLGGLTGRLFMQNPNPINIASSTKSDLQSLGITDFNGMLPVEIFGNNNIMSFQGFLFIVIGGFLVGFGVRYAGGCTSGHGFMGLSMASKSSLLAICAFFAGGLIMTNLIFPLIF